MDETEKKRVKRTQRDYTMAFKLAVVAQVERGELTYRQAQAAYGIQGRSTVLKWLRQHGSLDWSHPARYVMTNSKIEETPAQKIKRLEKELSDERLKNEVLSRMIEIADEQYGAGLRKKYFAKQSKNSGEANKDG
jgi:transposase-like protein